MIRLALVAAGGLILPSRARVSSASGFPFELAQNFAPHLLMLGIATLAFLSCFRLWRWAGATLLCLTWHAYLYLPNSGAGPGRQCRILAGCFLVETSSQRMIDYARDVAPELIVVADRSDGSHDHLPDLLPLLPKCRWAGCRFRKGDFGEERGTAGASTECRGRPVAYPACSRNSR